MAKAKAKDQDADKEEKDDEKDEKGKGKDEDGGEGAPEGGEGSPKKSKKKIIILGVVAIVLLIASGAGVYFSGILGGSHEETSEVELGPDGKPIEKPVFYTLPDFLINLNSGGKQTSFLKTTIILELSKQSDTPLVEANMPRLLDGFNTYLRELRSSDLAGSAGIQRLREELLLRANKALAPTKVNDVLFKEIIVQ